MSGENSDPIEAAWSEILQNWEDPGAHKRFVALCIALDRLPEAGQRYRGVRDGQDPARAAEAGRRIEAILTAAMSNLEATRSPPPAKRSGKLLLLAVIVFVALVGTATWLALGGAPP